jgi:hypothetical protein
MESKKSVVLPMLHLNGTSPETLQEGYLKAYRAINDAIAALNSLEFHSRDYYPIGPDAWTKARREREEQYDQLRSMSVKFMEVIELCQVSIDAKKRKI